jgi:glycosyltransferase involved in cell wall biosynthesis
MASLSTENLALPIDFPYALVIGGLKYRKGADAVIAVAQELRQLGSELKILVVGQSETAYQKIAETQSHLALMGIIADQELAPLLRGASSLLFLSPYEGFGIPPLEAMAAGVPAVVANCASLPEVVGDAGFVVDPFNTGEVVEILNSLCNDTRLRQTYIDKGRRHVKQYTWSNCADKVLEAFNKFG